MTTAAGQERRLFFKDEAALLTWGEQLAKQLKPGCIVGLQGPLGAGKTTLVRAIVRGLGLAPSDHSVHSPTFGLIHEYATRIPVVHFDLYRLSQSGSDPHTVQLELENIGVRDYFDGQRILLIEWVDLLPPKAMPIQLLLDLSFGPQPESRALRLWTQGSQDPAFLA